MTALISAANYATFTGDSTSSGTEVDAKIAVATGLVDEHCHRRFEFGTYTDVLAPSTAGRVYPKATPISSVSDPAGATVDGSAVTGVASSVLWPGSWPGVLERRVSVTYQGGYQPYGTTSGPTPGLPVTVARAIAAVAYNLLHPTTLTNVPARVTSVSEGDVSFSTSSGRSLSGSPDPVDEGVRRALHGFVKRQPAAAPVM